MYDKLIYRERSYLLFSNAFIDTMFIEVKQGNGKISKNIIVGVVYRVAQK